MDQEHKKILISLVGLTPQVLTETLYCLVINDFIPDEIHIITTKSGVGVIKRTLLDPNNSILDSFCNDMSTELKGKRYELCSSEKSIEQGGNLFVHGLLDTDDIRSYDDNVEMADTIIDVIRVLCNEPNTDIHCSIAGGRKTMGFLAGYAMSLFGRPQDTLSHVLIEPESYEKAKNFFYPRQKTDVTVTDRLTRDSKTLKACDAHVSLADIPFIKLGNYIPQYLKDNRKSYKDSISLIDMGISKDQARLSFGSFLEHRISCNGVNISLSPALYALYWWMFDIFFHQFNGQEFNPTDQIRSNNEQQYIEMIDSYLNITRDKDRIIKFNQIMLIESKTDRRQNMRMFIKSFFDSSYTRLTKILEKELTPELAELFGFIRTSRTGGFFCKLREDQVEFPK